jgi:hypothetical protein
MRLVITQHPVSGREIQSGTLPAHLWPNENLRLVAY